MTLGRRNNWEQFFCAVKAPKNYKDEVKKANYIAERLAERDELAHFCPLAATVTHCVVLDAAGNELFIGTGGFDSAVGKVSYNALLALGNLSLNNPAELHLCMEDIGAWLFGLRIRERLRIMALDALRYANLNKLPATTILPGLWYHKPFDAANWCDPYEAIIPSERRNDIPYDGLCQFLGIDLSGKSLDTDAFAQADIARQLTLRANLIDLEL